MHNSLPNSDDGIAGDIYPFRYFDKVAANAQRLTPFFNSLSS